MTDNEIISIDEAIRHCYETYFERDDLCRECREEHKQLAKWLEELKENRNTINRQRAEIERLQKNVDSLNIFTKNHIKVIRLQAIKEFAERLKRECLIDRGYNILQEGDIDNLVKEITEV